MLHTLAGFLIVKSLDQLLWKRFQNAGKSSERISANAQLARKRNSYANFVQNQSKNREWIRTTKTAWSESTETDTANQTLLVPTNMYIIQLHTWECVLLNKLVQTLCLWNNLCIIDCIAGVTLLDHLLWKHRSLESCVHLSTFQVDVLYVWLETHGLQIQNTFWNKHTNSDYHLKASGWQNSVLRRIACISSIDERKMAWSFVVESLLVRSFSIKNDCIWLYRMFFSLSPPKIDSLSLKSWGWHLLPSLMAWHRHLQ